MSRAALLLSLQSELMDSAAKFDDAALDRQLGTAARDLGRVKPLVKRDTLSLESDKADYTAPADMVRPYSPIWGKAEMISKNPWDDDWPGRLPHLTLENGTLYLTPPPTAKQITLLGSDYDYRYVAAWVIGETPADTNIPDALRDLILIRAVAAAMQDLAHRNLAKPTRLGECVSKGSQPQADVTPTEIAKQLIERFERMAV